MCYELPGESTVGGDGVPCIIGLLQHTCGSYVHTQARVEALLGGMNLSLRSWKSGVRCYVAFHGKQSHQERTCAACNLPFVCCQTPCSRRQTRSFHLDWRHCWRGVDYSGAAAHLETTWAMCAPRAWSRSCPWWLVYQQSAS